MIQAFCWVLIHSLWQGMLLALAGGAVIACTRRSAPALRYQWICALMVLFLGSMGATLYYEWTILPVGTGGNAGVGVSMNRISGWCSEHASQIVVIWLVLAISRSMWMATAWTYIRRIRREGLKAQALWADRVDELAARLGIRRTVKLVESALVRVPIVMGQLRPIIFVPLGLINHLPAGEMEAVLMHELAHVRRYDHMVNMMQQIAECILFYNPAFLWMSSVLREERENCCDDLAIAHTGDRVEFVRALVRFSEYNLHGTALAFPGNKRQLLHRVLRISRLENKTLSGRQRMVLLGGSLLMLALLAMRTDRVDFRKIESAKPRPEAGRQVAERWGKEAPGEMMSVLREREQVAQNMEWVQSQLDHLHRRHAVRTKVGRVREAGPSADISFQAANTAPTQAMMAQEQVNIKLVQAGKSLEQANVKLAQASGAQEQANVVLASLDRRQGEADMELPRAYLEQQPTEKTNASGDQAQLSREQADRDRQQAEVNRQQAEVNRQQAERNREQAQRSREQAQRSREQAERNRAQAERNREQNEKNRQQAELNRQQGERDRAQADLNRQQIERNRWQDELNRQQAERNGRQAEMDRLQAERNRRQAEMDRLQAEKDKLQADRDKQQAAQDREQAARDRVQADQAGTKGK